MNGAKSGDRWKEPDLAKKFGGPCGDGLFGTVQASVLNRRCCLREGRLQPAGTEAGRVTPVWGGNGANEPLLRLWGTGMLAGA